MLTENVMLENFDFDEIENMLQILPLNERVVMRMLLGLRCDKKTIVEISEIIHVPAWRIEQARQMSMYMLNKQYMKERGESCQEIA